MQQLRWLFVVCSFYTVGFSCAAADGAFEPKITDVCSASPHNPKVLVLNHRLLISRLVEKHLAISPIDLDKTGHGISDTDEANAILDPESFCNRPAPPGTPAATQRSLRQMGPRAPAEATSRCADKVAEKLGKGFIDLENFLHRHSVPTDPTKGTIDTSKLLSGNYSQQATLLSQFVRGNANPDIALCSPAVSRLTPRTPAPGELPAESSGLSDQANMPGYFSLRQRVDDLPIPQASSKFKSTKQANISFTDDWVATKASFSILAAGGYTAGPVSLDEAGHFIGQLTAFTLYNQQGVQTADPKKNISAENVGFGLLGDLTMPTGFDDAYQNIKIYPKYVQSLRNNAEVFSGNFVYTPMYGIPGIDSVVYVLGDTVSAKLTPEAKVVANDVIDRGVGATALKTGSYYWVGPYVDLKLFGEGIFSGFTYDVSYETYQVFSGLLKQISYFQTSLSYDFGTAKLLSITLAYQNGRDLNTLEKINMLTLGLGLKF